MYVVVIFWTSVPGICGRVTPCEHSAVDTEVIDPV